MKTLTELREWNTAHRRPASIKYGQSDLDISDEMDLVGDRARYESDRTTDLQLTASHGIDEVMKAERLDALLFPGPSGAALAARPGYPTVIVPFAMVPNAPTPCRSRMRSTRKPQPFGVSFTGTACSEPRLHRAGVRVRAGDEETRASAESALTERCHDGTRDTRQDFQKSCSLIRASESLSGFGYSPEPSQVVRFEIGSRPRVASADRPSEELRMTSSWKTAALLGVALAVGAAQSTIAANVVPANPTFTRDILPIFQKSCQACHRPGQMAPFSLLTYDDTRPWVRSIKNKVETRYMPPWHLDRTGRANTIPIRR